VKTVGIMDRIKLNARANLNYILSKAENPQKMLDQFLLEMRESVREVKEAVATAMVGMKKLERETSASAEKAAQWEERAVLALKKHNEELARKALEQKHVYVEMERNCKEELEKQKQTVQELKGSVSVLETKLDELYQRKIDLIKQHAQLQRRTAQMQSVSSAPVKSELDVDISAFDSYDRMVDKVRTLEAQAEALSELAEMDDVEAKFRKLERESEVEAELKAMKTKVQT
jgi:phage shock protein A